MSRARCRDLRAWAALGCVALLCAACNAPPAAAPPPPPPDKNLESPVLDTKAPVDPTEQSELDALDFDLVQANKHLEEQLERKRSNYYRADSGDSGEGELTEPPEPTKPKPDRKKQGQHSQGETGGATKPPTEPPPPPKLKDDEARDQPVGVRGSPCDLACRALHSMERSAERICALAGESSERCQKAKRMVQRATQRVRDAGCQCTDGNQELMSSIEPSALQREAVCSR